MPEQQEEPIVDDDGLQDSPAAKRHPRDEARIRKVVEILPQYVRGGKLLDVGAGTGTLAHALVQMGYGVEAVEICVPRAANTPTFTCSSATS